MGKYDNGAPRAAQSPGARAAIEAQCRHDEEWFASHPNRRLLARPMAPAESAAFLPCGSGTSNYPPECPCAVVIAKSGYFYHKRAVRLAPADVVRLAGMDDAGILAQLDAADRQFFQDALYGRLSEVAAGGPRR
jgi:hypothetical protein